MPLRFLDAEASEEAFKLLRGRKVLEAHYSAMDEKAMLLVAGGGDEPTGTLVLTAVETDEGGPGLFAEWEAANTYWDAARGA